MFADAPSELPPPPPSSSSNLIGDMSSMMQMPGGGKLLSSALFSERSICKLMRESFLTSAHS